MHNHTRIRSGPQTAGAIIHWNAYHDIFASLVGLGVNGSNSRMVVEMAQIKPGDKILDVGCGTGDLTLTAQRYAGGFSSAVGIDASSEGIEIALRKAKRSGSPTVFEVGLIEKIAYPDSTFDVVISRLVLHHLPDDLKRQGLKEIYRVLKAGGRLFLADFKPPTNAVVLRIASTLVGHRMMMQSNPRGLAPMLTETGFIDVASGPTRSAFLAFVSGKKPT